MVNCKAIWIFAFAVAIGLLERAHLSDSCVATIPVNSASNGSPASGTTGSSGSASSGSTGASATTSTSTVTTTTTASGLGCPGQLPLASLPVSTAPGFNFPGTLTFKTSPGGFVGTCTCAFGNGVQCEFDANTGNQLTGNSVFSSQTFPFPANTPITTTSPLISCLPNNGGYSIAATPAGGQAAGTGGPINQFLCGAGA